jgi:hypothetical protein
LAGGPIWRSSQLGPGWHLDQLGIYGACGHTYHYLYLIGLGTPKSSPPVKIERRVTLTA